MVVFARVLLLCILRRAFLKRACGSETAILVCAYVVVVAERDIAEFTEIHRDLQCVIGNWQIGNYFCCVSALNLA